MRKLIFLLVLIIVPAVALSAEVSLEWDPPDAAEPSGYNIYYGPSSGNYVERVDVGFVTEATIDGLSNGAEYFFAATAYYPDGSESGYSNEVSKLIPDPRPLELKVTGFKMDLKVEVTGNE
jgi:hypothetical protein